LIQIDHPSCRRLFASLELRHAMVHSLAFTTQGRLHTRDIDRFLMPTLLADTNLFLWVDLESPTAEETKTFLEEVFHFHPLSIEDCVAASPSPKVDEYLPREEDKFSPYLFIVIHAVDYSRKNWVFATSELNFFLGKNFLVPYYRDVDDALFHFSDVAQGYLDSLTGILQVYLNVSSNRTGEVVKLLTIITVITTPIMMVGTWYGMNFHNMPELSWKYGYAIAVGVTVISSCATYWYFKRKKWF
jgi:Mg2+ and Co2+ transporter CorA